MRNGRFTASRDNGVFNATPTIMAETLPHFSVQPGSDSQPPVLLLQGWPWSQQSGCVKTIEAAALPATAGPA
jgi:hypothetical protein